MVDQAASSCQASCFIIFVFILSYHTYYIIIQVLDAVQLSVYLCRCVLIRCVLTCHRSTRTWWCAVSTWIFHWWVTSLPRLVPVWVSHNIKTSDSWRENITDHLKPPGFLEDAAHELRYDTNRDTSTGDQADHVEPPYVKWWRLDVSSHCDK